MEKSKLLTANYKW